MAEEQTDSLGEARQAFFVRQQMIDSARTVFQLLSATLRNAALYPELHPILLTTADKLKGKIEDQLIGREEVSFYMAGGELFFEKVSVPVDEALAVLMEHFAAREAGGITFRRGVTTEEIIRFARIVNKDPATLIRSDINQLAAKENIVHIELHHVLVVDKNAGAAIKAGKQKPSEIFKDALATVKDTIRAVQLDKTSATRKMNTIVQTMVDNILENRDAFLGLTNIKMHDEYTFAHSVNVSILAVSLGSFLSFEKAQMAALGVAGLLHDIGKLTVPSEIINKPGTLTDEEWDTIKRHPVEGALLLAGIPGISKMAMVAAFEHHQHGPTRGYPLIDGEHEQHPFSQIISLADAYDAIIAPRVYYNVQTPPDEGVRILLKKRGTSFNPFLVNAFVKMVGIFPVGTLVKLDTGETALVKQQTSSLLRPRVLILTKFDGSEKESGLVVSLLETRNARYKRSIAGTIDPFTAGLNLKKYFD